MGPVLLSEHLGDQIFLSLAGQLHPSKSWNINPVQKGTVFFLIGRLIHSIHPECPGEGLVHCGCSITTTKSGGRNPSQLRVKWLLPCPFLQEEIQRDGGIFPKAQTEDSSIPGPLGVTVSLLATP